MKISKVETFLVRWGDVARPAEANFGAGQGANRTGANHAGGATTGANQLGVPFGAGHTANDVPPHHQAPGAPMHGAPAAV